jgi:hypothetical protein
MPMCVVLIAPIDLALKANVSNYYRALSPPDGNAL